MADSSQSCRRALGRSIAALLCLVGSLTASGPAGAVDCNQLREQEGGTFGYTSLTPGSGPYICPETGQYRPVVTPQAFRCSDGTPWVCYAGGAELQAAIPGYVDQCDGAVVYNFCKECNAPGCKNGGPASVKTPSSDATKEVGDPVDLSTGALEQTVTDLDLGGGLRFTRHYASGYNAQNVAIETAMGAKWRHSLQWSLVRQTGPDGEHVIKLQRPLASLELFVVDDPGTSGTFVGSQRGLGTLEGSFTGTLTYTSADGAVVTFGADDRVTSIALPGQPVIQVSYAGDTATYANGNASLAVTHFPAGTFKAGKVQQVSGGGFTVSYDYLLYDFVQVDFVLLDTVTAPDFSRNPATDSVVLNYDYTTSSSILMKSVDRIDSGGTDRLGEWTWTGSKVATADEDALDQKLKFWHGTSGTNEVTKVCEGTAACTSTSASLATVTSNGGVLKSITGLGGPGYSPRIKASTTSGGKWRTRTDQNGNVTLYEDYDVRGHPGRVVEGWVDDGDGVFDPPQDGYARVTETVWHPRLDEPLEIARASTLAGQPDAVTVFDYL